MHPACSLTYVKYLIYNLTRSHMENIFLFMFVLSIKEGHTLEKIIKEIQDLTWLSWSQIRNSSGTVGSFLKSYSDLGGQKIYYKLSNFDSLHGIAGHECINEIIVGRLLDILGVEHLAYRLIHAKIQIEGEIYTTWLCASQDFKQPGESKLSLEAYYQAERSLKETPLDFCINNGWGEYIWKMLVVDFLILNRDRHGANIEVLRNSKKKTLRLAPLFDHGISLLFQCTDDYSFEKADVMEDKPVQCFVGSRSAFENLKLIPADEIPKLTPLKKSDKKKIFEELDDALPSSWQDKIWDMIWKRWKTYEDFCNQR